MDAYMIDLWQSSQEYTVGKVLALQWMLIKLNSYMQKNKIRLLSYTIHQNQLKMF